MGVFFPLVRGASFPCKKFRMSTSEKLCNNVPSTPSLPEITLFLPTFRVFYRTVSLDHFFVMPISWKSFYPNFEFSIKLSLFYESLYKVLHIPLIPTPLKLSLDKKQVERTRLFRHHQVIISDFLKNRVFNPN